MKTALAASLIAVSLLGSRQQQSPPPTKFIVYGYGTASCGAWTAGRQNETIFQLRSAWIEGFVSGAGWYGAKMKEVDQDAINAWMDQYCGSHPLESISMASQALVRTLEKSN